MRYLPTPRHLARRGLTAGSAVTGALLWCAVIIVVILIRNPPAGDDADGQPESGTSGDSQSRAETPVVEYPQPNASSAPQMPARRLPDFTLKECMGDDFALSDLRGKPWVASFIFTRCVTTCPQITLAMMNLQNRVAADNPDVMFVTVTVNPEFDSETILRRYSKSFQPDRDRWKFLTGDKESIHDIVVNGFGVYVKENLGEARRAGFEVAHSNRVVLINSEGYPAGKFLGTNADDMAYLARILSGRKPFPDPLPQLQISSGGLDIQLVRAETTGTEPVRDVTEKLNHDDADTSKPSTSDRPVESGTSVRRRLARIDRKLPGWAKGLPDANAILNFISACLLVLGLRAIRSGRRIRHRNLMIAAFMVSVAFLGSYLASHWALATYTGERGRPFAGGAAAATVYYIILWPHVVLAATVPFLAVRVFQHAAAERWDKHRRLAKIAFPVWMYVSATGVIIYAMLYHWPVK